LGRLHAGRYRWLRRPRFATYFLWSGV
jgi:hypothetical protein